VTNGSELGLINLGHRNLKTGQNIARHPARLKDTVRFFIIFGLLLFLAETLLRIVGWIQLEIGRSMVNYGAEFELAAFVAAMTNGLLTSIGLIVLFGFFEWRSLGFQNFHARYSAGLLYSIIALIIATTVQGLSFLWLDSFEIRPLLRSDQLGPFLTLFPVLYMMVVGFFEYWLHRALHDIPILWKLHAIHHQIEHMNAARSYSHWAQDTLYLALITIPLIFLIEGPHEYVVLLTTLYLVSNYYMHTDNPALSFPTVLRHILADNIYHHYHHSRSIEHWGRNYCSFFSFYDKIFGTQHMPKDETFHPTGIDGYRPISGWRDYLVRPFMKE